MMFPLCIALTPGGMHPSHTQMKLLRVIHSL